MNSTKTKFSIAALLLVLVIAAVGCSTSTVVTTLEAIVAASEAALPLIPGLSSADQALVQTYLGDVTQAVACVAPELDSTDTAVIKAGKIVACFASLKIPSVSPQAQAIISAVNAAVQAFLIPFENAVQAQSVILTKMTLSSSDKAKVLDTLARNAKVAAQLKH